MWHSGRLAQRGARPPKLFRLACIYRARKPSLGPCRGQSPVCSSQADDNTVADSGWGECKLRYDCITATALVSEDVPHCAYPDPGGRPALRGTCPQPYYASRLAARHSHAHGSISPCTLKHTQVTTRPSLNLPHSTSF